MLVRHAACPPPRFRLPMPARRYRRYSRFRRLAVDADTRLFAAFPPDEVTTAEAARRWCRPPIFAFCIADCFAMSALIRCCFAAFERRASISSFAEYRHYHCRITHDRCCRLRLPRLMPTSSRHDACGPAACRPRRRFLDFASFRRFLRFVLVISLRSAALPATPSHFSQFMFDGGAYFRCCRFSYFDISIVCRLAQARYGTSGRFRTLESFEIVPRRRAGL